jgi:hypothetical protein
MCARGSQRGSQKRQQGPSPDGQRACDLGALEGIRTPNLLIRSQMLYPLSYERRLKQYMAVGVLTVRVHGACTTTAVIERRSLILNGLKGAGHQRVRPP